MKLQLIVFALIFYSCCVDAEQKSQLQQIVPHPQHPTSLQIIIHAETQSGLDQDNSLAQKAKHASTPTTTVDTTIKQERTDQQLDKICDEKIKTAALYTVSGLFFPLSTLAYYLYTKISNKK